MPRAPASAVDLQQLSLSHLAYFVGLAANRQIVAGMRQAGFGDVREAHGFLIQHLLRGPHSIGELARLLGITQQAVSKSVAELRRGGYVEPGVAADARLRVVQLSERGRACVLASRKLRLALDRRLAKSLGAQCFVDTQQALADALSALGGAEAVKHRRVRASDAG